MKRIEELNRDEAYAILDFIGHGARPIRAAKKFFPYRLDNKNIINDTKAIRSYLWNRVVAMDEEIPFERRVIYIKICSEIYIDMSDEVKNYEFLPNNCPDLPDYFKASCMKCEADLCPFPY